MLALAGRGLSCEPPCWPPKCIFLNVLFLNPFVAKYFSKRFHTEKLVLFMADLDKETRFRETFYVLKKWPNDSDMPG